MLPFLSAIFPSLAKEAISTIAEAVTNKKSEEIREEDLNQEQKLRMIELASKMQGEVNQTMRTEAQSEHLIVRAWRPLTIYGLGALVISISIFQNFGGLYFIFEDYESWEKFHQLLETNERSTNLLMTGFFALCGIYFPLRSAEKGVFGKLKNLIKK